MRKARSGDRIERTVLVIFFADDGCDVGADTGAPVSRDQGATGNGSSERLSLVNARSPADRDSAFSQRIRETLPRPPGQL